MIDPSGQFRSETQPLRHAWPEGNVYNPGAIVRKRERRRHIHILHVYILKL